MGALLGAPAYLSGLARKFQKTYLRMYNERVEPISADDRSPESAEIGSPPTTSDNIPSPMPIGRRDRCWDWRTS